MTNEERAASLNEKHGTAWNGSRGWTFGPPIVFVLALIVILVRCL